MPTILFNSNSKLAKLFDVESDFKIPFLAGTLLDIHRLLFRHTSIFLPFSEDSEGYSSVMDINWEEREMVFLVPANSIPVQTNLVKELEAFCINNPGNFYKSENGFFGFVSKSETISGTGLDLPEDLETGFVKLDENNYTEISLEILSGLRFPPPPPLDPSNRVLGQGVFCFSAAVQNSTLCGPCFVSENSVLNNSTVFPGSLVVDSVLQDATVFSDSVVKSYLKSTVTEQSLILKSNVTGGVFRGSLFPAHSKIIESNRKIQ